MYITVTFGYEGPSRVVPWGKDRDQFPRFLLYQTKRWEWVTYDLDDTGKSDWVLLFSQLPTYDPNYCTEMEDFEEKFFGSTTNVICQCGANHTSFPHAHLKYCSLYTKW